MKNWTKTQIWNRIQKLESDEAKKISNFLMSDFCMDKIETILDNGNPYLKDFTLHDSDHSFRVAERIWEIIPPQTREILSEYELALLILSAYLHDIGMAPEFKKVNNHYCCLNTKEKKLLNQEEKISFQKWLDEEGEQIDIENDYLDDNGKASEITTFYCRYMHNDWSELWILENFRDKELANYTNWIKDLINVCKSHHYDLDELKSDKFNPLRIHGKVIHKRYIAMCLRLADVLEIDPERAPIVLIKQRDIIKGSISHWLKEKFTSIDIINDCIIVTANPTKAFIHKAIIDVADQIEHESNLCNTLKGEIPLRNITPSNDLRHEWNILPSVFRVIKEEGNYEFIDGTFKPNTKKILQLLAGTQLYGNPILAIKELIQNSIDAIKIQLGYKIIEEKLSSDESINSIKNNYLINLEVKNIDNEYWIICRDNGVGMDKEVIKKCFLVGGASKRHELLELERKCRSIGYNLEITSQFGIGVLSYFMIAEKLIIRTRKSKQADYHDPNGWEFEINGLSDFGELRKLDRSENGTEVLLKIKKEISANPNFKNGIKSLLEQILVRIPCNFKLTIDDISELKYSPNWCKSEQFFINELVAEFNRRCSIETKTSEDFISDENRAIIATSSKRKLEIDKVLQDSIEFHTSEGPLALKNGYYRIHLPLFKNDEGLSFSFFFEKHNNSTLFLQKINDGFLFQPKDHSVKLSWKGIEVGNHSTSFRDLKLPFCFIEVDLTNDKAFQISVSRQNLMFKSSLETITNELVKKVQSLILGNQKRLMDSKYAFQNYLDAPFIKLNQNKLYWTTESSYNKDEIEFKKIKFPVVFDISTSITDPDEQLYKNTNFYRLYDIKKIDGSYSSPAYSISKYRYKFDCAVFAPYYNYRITFLTLKSFKEENKYSYIGNSAIFPPEWDKLFCFRGYHEYDIIINESNPLTKYISSNEYFFIVNFFLKKMKLSSKEANMIIRSKSKCFCFMLYLISKNEMSYWDALLKNNLEFAIKLWKKMFNNQTGIIYFFFDGISNTHITSISLKGWLNTTVTKEIKVHLPIPDFNWQIVKKPKR